MKVDLSGESGLVASPAQFSNRNKRTPSGMSQKVFSPGRKVSSGFPQQIINKRPARFPHGCHIDINCGSYTPCAKCRNSPRQFENLSEDEIVYVMENAPNPELMGAALKKFLRKTKKKVSAKIAKVVKKIAPKTKAGKIALGILAAPLAPGLATKVLTAKAIKTVVVKKERQKAIKSIKKGITKAKAAIKKLPKPLRIAAGIALAPLAPTIATAAMTAVPVKLATSPKARKQLVKDAKNAKKKIVAAVKKLPKPLRIVAGIALAPLMPATTTTLLATAAVAAPIAATGLAAKKATQAVQKAKVARVAAQQARIEEKEQEQEEKQAAVQAPGQSYQAPSPSPVPEPTVQEDEGETITEPATKKKSPLATILPVAALALLPFLFGE